MKRRYLYLAAGALLGAFLFLAIRSYRSVDRELTAAALARRTAVASLASAVLTEKFDRLIDIGVALSTRVRFRELLTQGRWTEAIEILRSVPKHFSFIERVFLTDSQGTERADIPALTGAMDRNFAFRQWYRAVSAHWTPSISTIYRRTASPTQTVFAVPVPIRSTGGQMLGILVLQIDLASFFDWAQSEDLGPQGAIYIVDSRGQVAFYPGRDPQGPIANWSADTVVRRLLRGESGVGISPDPLRDIEEVAAYAPAVNGWGAVAEEPVALVFASRDQELRRIVTGYLLLGILGIAVAFLAMRLLTERAEAAVHKREASMLEGKVAERTAELAASNQELESFSYSVSHDLRAPLRAIDGFAQMLEEDFGGKLDAEGSRLLAVVRDSARKMGALIDDLLAFSRLGRKPISAGEVDSSQLVSEVLSDLRDQAAHAQVLVSDLPKVWADRSLLKQVWSNLLGNALKYSSNVPAPRIEIGGREQGDECVFSVRDNGVGFDMRYVDKLFGVFQRLHSEAEFPGTGVGLAIVRRIVGRHGGRVWAEGSPQAGASFYFTLPKQERT